MWSARVRRRVRLAAAGLLLATVTLVSGGTSPVPVAQAHHINEFYEGVVQYSTILNCFSIIGGYTYSEKGAGAWVGFESNPQQSKPAVNESFDITINVFGLGNACSGQRFVPAFNLPAGVQLDTANRPITCWSSKNGGSLMPFSGPTDCPAAGTNLATTPNAVVPGANFAYLSSDTQNARTWPLPAGVHWQFRIPVKSTTMQSGAQLQGMVKMFDGNSSPILTPTQGLFVYNGGQASATPTIWHEQPTTVAAPILPTEFFPPPTVPLNTPSAYGVYSVAYVNTAGTEGTTYVLLGTTPGSDDMVAQQSPDPALLDAVIAGQTSPSDPYDTYSVAVDWLASDGFLPLQRGTTYYWRLYYGYGAGPTFIAGDIQSFTLPPTATCNGQAVTVDLSLGQQPTDGDDVILGTSASETIAAQAGNDTICALGGNDTILGGAGNDWIDGGPGIDTASYENSAAGVTVAIKAGAQTTGEGTDTLGSVENLTGSRFGDQLTGNGDDNVLGGLAGNDVLVGGGGNDTLVGADGNDTSDGGPGNDTLDGGTGTNTASYTSTGSAVTVNLGTSVAQNTGGAGTDRLLSITNVTGSAFNDRLTGNNANNVLLGLGGNDTLTGGPGNDTLDGGPGTDTASYSSASSGVTVNLATTSAQNTGGAGTDTLRTVENLVGTSAKDRLTGNGAANKLTGGGSADRLAGAAGSDTLVGGPGQDRCDGGSGRDRKKTCEVNTGFP